MRVLSNRAIAYRLLWLLDAGVPSVLLKAWLQRWSSPPAGTLLTYAHGHLVFRPEPWLVEVEYPSLLLGMNLGHLAMYRMVLERVFASRHCRGVLFWSDAGRRALLSTIRCEPFMHKIAVVPHAVPARQFTKVFREGCVRILFVGSGNIKGEFEGRGGWEVLEVFSSLRRRYGNLELVVRSDLPAAAKTQFRNLPGVRLHEQVVPWEVLEQEFRNADIFLLPSHSTPPFALMDAMSFELPVVSIDAWANGEIVENGRTGFLAPTSKHVPYYHGETWHCNFGSRSFRTSIQRPDPVVVGDLAAKLTFLIEHPEERRLMGRAGRWEVEHGRFSIRSRNEKLQRVLDSAISEGPHGTRLSQLVSRGPRLPDTDAPVVDSSRLET